MSKKIVISINAAWNVINFRSGLMKALCDSGYDVVVMTPEDKYSEKLADLGVEHVPINIDNDGTSPMRDGQLLVAYWNHLKNIRPIAFLSYTAKPNIYGSLAAAALNIPVLNNVSGLGTPFLRPGLIKTIVSALYRIALLRSHVVFFQNDDDRDLFAKMRLVRRDQARVLPGSGVDIDWFCPRPERRPDGQFVFLLTGRMLWDKGIGEFIEAARTIRRSFPQARFQLLGFLDVANPSAIARDQIVAWEAEGVVEYLGSTGDVRPYIAAADCVVLPSYREGLPRSLLEAAAMGKPLIASDVPGCRALVRHGTNGLLFDPGQPNSLADAIAVMLAADPAALAAMGRHGREIAVREYDEKIVVEAYLRAIREVSPQLPPHEEHRHPLTT